MPPMSTASGLGAAQTWVLAGSDTTERSMTSATAGDLVTVTGLTIPATTPVMIVISVAKAAAAFTPSLGLKINATVVSEAVYGGGGRILSFPATNEAQNGIVTIFLAPRRTGYDRGITGTSYVSGATALQTELLLSSNLLTAAIPVATITDVIIRGDSDGTNALTVHGVYVYTLAVS